MSQAVTSVPHPIPVDLSDLIAQRFRVIGEPLRIRLLDHLRDGESSVHALTNALGATQQNVSKHLQVLFQAGIVARRKDGTTAMYRIVDSSVFDLCELVCGGLQRQVAEMNAVVRGETR
ncbi:metalloregulator ArsR/SmtB family transcription factor [Paraconexibacter antarcticus]|uniref:Metalloregulator ArsR/SmtB family transcription factor n=1 Tax=Paraconexibacter antarcticus TaxID=2949664 RepID=A0ABY5DYT3_9ACTN|nr:metalloregulator ArsR/SmtB family transcription factor [Paraconexibacter antarcticus]UTI66851.1 metalloregulator ArsR/SmtB family transcription factor [Paraconexibacter antarcticus]